MLRSPVALGALVALGSSGLAQEDTGAAAAERIGERLFSDARFSQPFAVRGALGAPAVSCRSCHFVTQPRDSFQKPPASRPRELAFADDKPRSAIPPREDGRTVTTRNSPALVDAFSARAESGLLHFDGEFASAETLVAETFLGRNFGWLLAERTTALQHFARVVRENPDATHARASSATAGYAALLASDEAIVPAEFRLPVAWRIDVTRATDEEILRACARLVVVFVRSLHFSRDAHGQFDGSPYDAFLAANRLPRAPSADQSLADYGRRMGEQLAALRRPIFVDEPARMLRRHDDQPFRFAELELAGARVFFRSAISNSQQSGAGNCAECHVPPHFTDFLFHNTGVAQDDYDAVHGHGAFAALEIPELATREADPNRWLPASAQHPFGRGLFLLPVAAERRGEVDLGLWNVYGNPGVPVAQLAIERTLSRGGRSSRSEILARSVGGFKTSSLRDLGQSAPYFHTGTARTIEDAILFYRRMSALARAAEMRNAPPEYFPMRLGPEDLAPLAAFLRALNEDFPATRK